MKIKAAVTYSKGAEFQVEEVELAEPKDGEVLVRMAGCGICQSDLAAREQELRVPLPAVLGHEGSGIVERVGKDVKTIKPGDHVVFCSYACGECEACRSGHPGACVRCDEVDFGGAYADGTTRLTNSEGKALSSFFSQSSFATYAIADEKNTVKVDDDVDIALLGPLGCGIQTGAGSVINRLRPQAGDSFVVFGCGSVGLSAVMAAKLCGCLNIIGVDVVPGRMELAKELGATHVINGKEVDDIPKLIKDITEGGADISLDTSAVPKLINDALYCLKRRGTAAIVGSTGDTIVGIQLQYALMGESKSLVGIVQGDSVPKLFIPKLVKLYKAGKFPFDKLVKYYPLDDINKAFADSMSGQTIKPIIKF